MRELGENLVWWNILPKRWFLCSTTSEGVCTNSFRWLKLTLRKPLHFKDCVDLLVKWIVKVTVAQPCLTLCNPMDCSLPGSSVHGILQARILEWLAIPFSRGSSQTRDWTQVSRIAGRFYTVWATRETQNMKMEVLGIEPRISCVLSLYSTTEPYPPGLPVSNYSLSTFSVCKLGQS